MNDSIGVPIEIGDWVAFYKTARGKSIFGKVIDFNKNTMVIQPNVKGNTITKNPMQVLKISKELIENKKIVINDSIGNELKIGDWVAATNIAYNDSVRNYYDRNFHGKIVFGSIEKLSKSSIEIKVRTRKTSIKKAPNQVVKISDEQAMLHMLAQG